MKRIMNWRVLLVLCATIGLAPYSPPHIWEDLKWIAGGAVGMKLMNWLDFFMHGTPWFLLIGYSIHRLVKLIKG